jgi:hypothetical protein
VHAHAASTSFLELTQARDATELGARWDFAVADLAETVDLDSDLDAVVTWREMQEARGSIERLVAQSLALRAAGALCSVRLTDLALAHRFDEPFVSVLLAASCANPGELSVTTSLFFSADSAQRVLLRATLATQTFNAVLSPQAATWQAPASPSPWATLSSFVAQGFHHVLIGSDHIVFIVLLLLPAVLVVTPSRGGAGASLKAIAWDVAKLVTAFTVAHSITLALAATKAVELPAQPVEITIALSIVVAGVANLFHSAWRGRLAIAFGFGLVHGFGFANVLQEIDAGGAELLPLLAGFNIGVELAQLAIVATLLPVLYAIRDAGWYARWGLPLGSCGLAAVGAWWMLTRFS